MFKTLFAVVCVAVAVVAATSGPQAAVSFARNIGIVSGTAAGSATVKAQTIVASAAGNGGHVKLGNPPAATQKKAKPTCNGSLNPACTNLAKDLAHNANQALGGAAGDAIAKGLKQVPNAPKLVQGPKPLVPIRGGHGMNLPSPNPTDSNAIGGGGDFNVALGGGGDFKPAPAPTPAPLPTTSQYQLPAFGH